MKKLLSLLMVTMLVVTLAVPAFAEEEYTLFGKYGFYLIVDFDETYSADFDFVSNGKSFTGLYTVKNGSNYWIAYRDPSNAAGSIRVYNSGSDTLWEKGDEYRFIEFVEPVSVSKEFYDWFTANARPLTCDGSTCPATDVNVDSICDDCGMQLFNLQRTPVVPDVTGANKHWALFSGTWEGQQGWYYVVSTSSANYTIRGELTDEYYKITYDDSAESSLYVSYDGINWEREAIAFTSSRFVPLNDTTALVDSSHNWYDANGELFFPLPLWVEMVKLTQGEMMVALEETLGTMKTLMVCGVGCLALLVVLSLFGKRSLISRG